MLKNRLSHIDFLVPIMMRLNKLGLSAEDTRKVGVAFDCAILFGAVQGIDGIGLESATEHQILSTWLGKIEQLASMEQ